VVREDVGGYVRMNETGQWCFIAVPICNSVDIQTTTCGLTAVHVNLVEGLYQSACYQIMSPTGYYPVKESVGDG
jgi:hypothetical protein